MFLCKWIQEWIDEKQCVRRQRLRYCFKCIHAHKINFATSNCLAVFCKNREVNFDFVAGKNFHGFQAPCLFYCGFAKKFFALPSFFILRCSLEKSQMKGFKKKESTAFCYFQILSTTNFLKNVTKVLERDRT